MIIRSDIGRRRALEQRTIYEEALGRGESRSVYTAKIAEIDEAIGEYERLKAGGVRGFSGEGVYALAEAVTKARVARGMTLAELGERMGMLPQQVQRYEDEGWRRAGLWRLKRAADALGLRVRVEVEILPGAEADEGRG